MLYFTRKNPAFITSLQNKWPKFASLGSFATPLSSRKKQREKKSNAGKYSYRKKCIKMTYKTFVSVRTESRWRRRCRDIEGHRIPAPPNPSANQHPSPNPSHPIPFGNSILWQAVQVLLIDSTLT